MGVKSIAAGGMFSDSKTVNRITEPIKKYGMDRVAVAPAAQAAARVTNFEEELKTKRKSTAPAVGIGANLIN